jgi:hypothetical protein
MVLDNHNSPKTIYKFLMVHDPPSNGLVGFQDTSPSLKKFMVLEHHTNLMFLMV